MKRFGFRVLVGLIAFAIGVGFTISFISLTEEETCYRNPNSTTINSNFSQFNSGKVEFEFKRFVFENDYKQAEFVLKNNSLKDIYYFGYSVGSYCTFDFKQKGKIKKSPLCCGNGLDTRALESSKEQIFKFFLNDWNNVNQVGFYIIDEGNNEQTIWSNKF